MKKIATLLFTAGLLQGLAARSQSTATLPSAFSFKLGITYEMTGSTSGGQERNTQITYLLSDKDYAGFEAGGKGMTMVYDLPHQQMITLMEPNKMAMIMNMKQMQARMEAMNKDKQPEPDNNFKVTRTGKTEKILGYTCDIYEVSSTKSTMLAWITKELGSGYSSFAKSFSMMMKNNRSAASLPEFKEMAGGVMLKMQTTSKENNTTTTLEAKSIDKGGKVINTTGYKVMAMPGTAH